MKQVGGSKNYLQFPDEIKNADDMRTKFRFYASISHGKNLKQVFKVPEKTYIMFGQQSGIVALKTRIAEDDFTNFMFIDNDRPETINKWYDNLYEQITKKQFFKDLLFKDEDPYEPEKVSIYYPGDIVQNVRLSISDDSSLVTPIGIWRLPIPPLPTGYNIKTYLKTYMNEYKTAKKHGHKYVKEQKHTDFYENCENNVKNIVKENIPLRKTTLCDLIAVAQKDAKKQRVTSEYTFILIEACRIIEGADSNVGINIGYLKGIHADVETNLSYWLKLKKEISTADQQRALSVAGRNLPKLNEINVDSLKIKFPTSPSVILLDNGHYLPLDQYKQLVTLFTEDKLSYFDVDPKTLYKFIGERKLFEPGQIVQFSPFDKTKLKPVETLQELQSRISQDAETAYKGFIKNFLTNKQSYTTDFKSKSPMLRKQTIYPSAGGNPYDDYMINYYKQHFNVKPGQGLGLGIGPAALINYELKNGSAISLNDNLWTSSNTYKNMIFGIVLSNYKIDGELYYKVLCFYEDAAGRWTSSICMIEPFHLFAVNATQEQSQNLCNFINQNFNTSINNVIDGENKIINDYLTILRPFNLI